MEALKTIHTVVAQRQPRPAHRKVVILMVAFSVLSYFDRTIMSIAGPVIMKQFGLSEPQMGSIYTAFLVSYAAMNLPGGLLADRLGPHQVLTWVGLGAGLFTALTAFAGIPGLGSLVGIVPAFFAIRFAMGICTGPLYPTCAKAIGTWVARDQHAETQGLVTAGAGLGGAISPLLFVWMIGHFGWRYSFLLAGFATAILALIWRWRIHPGHLEFSKGRRQSSSLESIPMDPRSPRAQPGAWGAQLRNPHLLLLTTSCFCLNYFDYVFFFWIYYYMESIRHFERIESAIATTVIFLTGTVMSPLGGRLSDRLVERYGERRGRRIVPVVGLTLAVILLCLSVHMTTSVSIVVCLSLAFGLSFMSDSSYWAAAIRMGGKHTGVASGILNTGANLGGIAPYIAPLIASRFGWTWGLYSAAVVLMSGVVIWFFIDPTRSPEVELVKVPGQ